MLCFVNVENIFSILRDCINLTELSILYLRNISWKSSWNVFSLVVNHKRLYGQCHNNYLALFCSEISAKTTAAARYLRVDNGIRAEAINSDLTQSRRTTVMNAFRTGKIKTLIVSKCFCFSLLMNDCLSLFIVILTVNSQGRSYLEA